MPAQETEIASAEAEGIQDRIPGRAYAGIDRERKGLGMELVRMELAEEGRFGSKKAEADRRI